MSALSRTHGECANACACRARSPGPASTCRPRRFTNLSSEVDVDAELAGLVAAALAMARSLHLVVAAEGVETKAEQAFVQVHSCDMAQGYLHARPIPAPEFETWMARVDGGQRLGTGHGVDLSHGICNFRKYG